MSELKITHVCLNVDLEQLPELYDTDYNHNKEIPYMNVKFDEIKKLCRLGYSPFEIEDLTDEQREILLKELNFYIEYFDKFRMYKDITYTGIIGKLYEARKIVLFMHKKLWKNI